MLQTLDSTGNHRISRDRVYKIAIESPNTADFIALKNEIYARLGFEEINLPVPPRPLPELSLVVGLCNDMRNLGKFLQNRWKTLQQSARRRFAS